MTPSREYGACLLLCVLSCSSEQKNLPRASAAVGGAGAAGAAGTSAVAGTTGQFDAGVALVDGAVSTCETRCAEDLRRVLDCNDKVVLTCPPGQGCAGNQCIDACEAAKANGSTIGCEFYSIAPADIRQRPACFAALVANTWPEPVKIQVDYAGAALDVKALARIPVGSGTLTY